MAIDWVEGSTEQPALVWGYRWDGEARGRDMLAAIVTADPRLFAKFGGTATSPNAVYGLGYDFDNDGQFAIDDDTTFDSAGIAISGPADGAVTTDSDDYYAEGWFDNGFWQLFDGTAGVALPGNWTSNDFGATSPLVANGWFAFSITTPDYTSQIPDQPHGAGWQGGGADQLQVGGNQLF